jgi:hypothetical protein
MKSGTRFNNANNRFLQGTKKRAAPLPARVMEVTSLKAEIAYNFRKR